MDIDDLRSSADFDFEDDESDIGQDEDSFDFGDEAVMQEEGAAAGGFTPVERLILMAFGFLNVIALVVILLLATGRIG